MSFYYMKKLMMLAVALTAAMPLMAETETVGDYTWTYQINGDTAEIYKSYYSAAISPSPTGTVIIPSMLGGKTVTSVGSSAFYGCSGLTSVTIPDSVTRIGYEAFSGCSGLTSVTIPDSVTSIGDSAFYGCSELATVNISDFAAWCSILYDDYDARYDAEGLGNKGNPLRASSDAVLLLNGNAISGDFIIPEDVKHIPSGTFRNCIGLTSVTMPDGMTSIGASAFKNCIGLMSVKISNAVTNIGYRAFYNCCSLSAVSIPGSVERFGSQSFGNCTGLLELIFNDGVKSINGEVAFGGCANLTKIVFPDSVRSVLYGAFHRCTNLCEVILGRGVIQLGRRVFADCPQLYKITILGDAPDVDSFTFENVRADCTAYVRRESTGWGVEIPGVWGGINIEYIEGDEHSSACTVMFDANGESGGKSVTVPGAWIAEHAALVEAAGGDALATLTATAANGRMSVAECYVVGLDPEVATNDFKITSFPLKADGTPDIEHIVFDPPQAKWNVSGARPVVKGAAALDGEWQPVTDQNEAGFRFFKVTVELP